MPQPEVPLTERVFAQVPETNSKGFQALDLMKQVTDATIVMTSNRFKVLRLFEDEVEYNNNLVLGALPHQTND